MHTATSEAMAVTEPDRLVLIRHAMPEIDPQIPAERWHLGDRAPFYDRAVRQDPILVNPNAQPRLRNPVGVKLARSRALPVARRLLEHLRSG